MLLYRMSSRACWVHFIRLALAPTLHSGPRSSEFGFQKVSSVLIGGVRGGTFFRSEQLGRFKFPAMGHGQLGGCLNNPAHPHNKIKHEGTWRHGHCMRMLGRQGGSVYHSRISKHQTKYNPICHLAQRVILLISTILGTMQQFGPYMYIYIYTGMYIHIHIPVNI